jgi:acetyl esterase/lipase
MRKRLILFTIFGQLLFGCNNIQPATLTPLPMPTGRIVKTISSIAYVRGEDLFQSLDLYIPEGEKQVFPTMMIIHGSGADKSDWSALSSDFTEEGYAVAAINYRMTPQYNYRNSIQDAFCALAWLHTNSSKYGLDPARIVVMGFSFGGTLASLIGTVDDPTMFMEDCPNSLPESNWIDGIITVAGILDLIQAADSSAATHDLLVEALGSEPQDAHEAWAQVSPIEWVDGSEPPFLIIHGLKDNSVDPDQARRFTARLQEVGTQVDMVFIEEADHGSLQLEEEYQQALESFLANLWKQN